MNREVNVRFCESREVRSLPASHLFFGILADFDTVLEIDELARGLDVALARLVAISKRRRCRRDQRGLSLVVSA